MRATTLGSLQLTPIADALELVAAPVREAVAAPGFPPAWVAPIDAELSDTAEFCRAYDVPPAASANCVVVTGKREGQQRWAAAVLLATTRAEVNTVIRRRLDVRKISFASMADATSQTGMEYGGITPIGLPAEWPILLGARVIEAGPVVIGSGIRASKIVIDGADLAKLPGAEVIDGLGR